ncbi:hypothetical protein ACW2Q0_10065 [Nocardia sp. R16R-3T]
MGCAGTSDTSTHFLGTGHFRTHDRIRDLELVDPGLVYLPQRRPSRIVREKPTVIERVIDAIAGKP